MGSISGWVEIEGELFPMMMELWSDRESRDARAIELENEFCWVQKLDDESHQPPHYFVSFGKRRYPLPVKRRCREIQDNYCPIGEDVCPYEGDLERCEYENGKGGNNNEL